MTTKVTAIKWGCPGRWGVGMGGGRGRGGGC